MGNTIKPVAVWHFKAIPTGNPERKTFFVSIPASVARSWRLNLNREVTVILTEQGYLVIIPKNLSHLFDVEVSTISG